MLLLFFLNILFYSETTWGSLLFLSTYFYLFLPVLQNSLVDRRKSSPYIKGLLWLTKTKTNKQTKKQIKVNCNKLNYI